MLTKILTRTFHTYIFIVHLLTIQQMTSTNICKLRLILFARDRLQNFSLILLER